MKVRLLKTPHIGTIVPGSVYNNLFLSVIFLSDGQCLRGIVNCSIFTRNSSPISASVDHWCENLASGMSSKLNTLWKSKPESCWSNLAIFLSGRDFPPIEPWAKPLGNPSVLWLQNLPSGNLLALIVQNFRHREISWGMFFPMYTSLLSRVYGCNKYLKEKSHKLLAVVTTSLLLSTPRLCN